MKASDLFVKALEAEDVEYVFGVPGEENIDLLESLRKSDSIQFILTRHEQSAGFMAATYGRLTGKAGVCLSTLGPGATNLATAAAFAQLGAMPLVMITGQKPIRERRQGKFQIVDIVDMMQPLSKLAQRIPVSEEIPSLVREAFRMAQAERPGAAHLELPEDVAAAETNAQLLPRSTPRRPSPDRRGVEEAAQLIRDARNPLLMVGAGANRNRVSQALASFVESTGIYFFNTQMGKGVIDETHPRFLGTAALSENDYLHCAIEEADLIINVGHDVVEKPPFTMKADGAKVIHVNDSPATVDPVYFPQAEVIGDIANSVAQLMEALGNGFKAGDGPYETLKASLDEQIGQKRDDARFPPIPQRIIGDLREVLPDDGILALDNGMYKVWFARNYLARRPNTVLLDNALATMGAGLPAAIAARIACPEKKVVALCGDGGFMMNSQELETAVRLKLDLLVIVLRDDGLAMIKWKQQKMGLPAFGLDFANPDFVKYAEAYGAKGIRLKTTEALRETLANALAEPGVTLLDLPIDYSENQVTLVDELKEKTCALGYG